MMAELQFEGAAAERQSAELMPEANSEDGRAAKKLANIRDGVGDRLGIARTIREKHAVGFQRQHIFGGSFRGNHGDIAAMIDQQAKNILLDAEIVRDHAIALPRFGARSPRTDALASRHCRERKRPLMRPQRSARRDRSSRDSIHRISAS